MTTVPGRKSSAALMRSAVWLWSRCSHQWRAMNSGSTTVSVSFGALLVDLVDVLEQRRRPARGTAIR